MDRVRMTLESEVLRLESKKRDEQVDAWKDITRIKKDLFESLESYFDARTSGSFIDGYRGGEN